MAVAIKLDTLKYAKRLIAAGMPQQQAEIQAEVFIEVIDENLNNFATKEDFHPLKEDVATLKIDGADLKKDIANLKEDVAILKVDVADLKKDVGFIKQDVYLIKENMKSLDQGLRVEMQTKNNELKIVLIKWMLSIAFTVSTAQGAAIVGLLKFFH